MPKQAMNNLSPTLLEKSKRIASYCLVLLVAVVFFYTLHRITPWAYSHMHFGTPTWWLIEQEGPTHVVAWMLLIISGAAVIGLFFLYKETRAFTARRGRFYWAYLALAMLCFLQLVSVVEYFIQRYPPESLIPPQLRHQTPAYELNADLRIAIVITLLMLGIILYLLKQSAKITYGLCEITVAIISTSASVMQIDVSHFPKIPLSGTDYLSLITFTYLLSRGVTNTAEGIDEWRHRQSAG